MSAISTQSKQVKIISDSGSVRVASTKAAVDANKQAIKKLITSLRK